MKFALPAESVPDPSRVAPLKKFTVPERVPAPEVTVAVSATFCPKADAFGDEERTVVVAAGFTVCESVAELEDAKLPEATKAAFRLCVPAARALVVKLAKPPERVPDPSCTAPSKKFTVPLGDPSGEVTVAVNVTLPPKTEGFRDDDKLEAVGAEFTI